MKKGWEQKRLGETIKLQYGKALDKSHRKPNGKFPVYGANGAIDRTDKSYHGEPSIIIGRKGSAGEVNLTEEKFWPLDVTYFITFDKSQHDLRFLYFLLITCELNKLAKGVKPGINRDDVYNLLVRVPPLLEQKRIVRILDEAFAAIATAKANTEKNLQNARAIFESHLNDVFTKRGDGWVEKRLETVTTKIGSGATPRGGEASYKAKGKSLIRSLNVHDLEFRYDRLAFIDDKQAGELSNVTVQSRDVLLNITGASVARCTVVPDNVLPAFVNQHVSIIRPKADTLNSEFLHYQLISKPYKDRLLNIGEDGGSTRQAITKAQIQEFAVMFPKELAEQNKIVNRLNEIRGATQGLLALHTRKLAALEELKKSLLHQAFNGEL